MFSPEDQWAMDRLAASLKNAGYDTYLPQRDGLETWLLINAIRDNKLLLVLEATVARGIEDHVMQAGYCLDMYNLVEHCDGMVFSMNGRVPDGGSVVEATGAAMAGKPLVIYKDTPIKLLGNFDSPMITGLTAHWDYAGTPDEVPVAMGKLFEAHTHYTYDPPPAIAHAVKIGKEVADANDLLHDLEALKKGGSVEEALRALHALEHLLGDLFDSKS